MQCIQWLVCLCVAGTSLGWHGEAGEEPAGMPDAALPDVVLTASDDRVRVLAGGELFAEYVFQGYSRPIVYPIIGPRPGCGCDNGERAGRQQRRRARCRGIRQACAVDRLLGEDRRPDGWDRHV